MSNTTIVRTHQHSADAPKKTNQLNASAEVKADEAAKSIPEAMPQATQRGLS